MKWYFSYLDDMIKSSTEKHVETLKIPLQKSAAGYVFCVRHK